MLSSARSSMQTSIATPVAAAFAVCAISGGLYYMQLLHLRGDLSSTRNDLRAARVKVEELRDQKTALFASFVKSKKDIETVTALVKSKAAVGVEAAALEKELSSVREELMNHVRSVRGGASGELIPVLRLTDGEVLNHVKVQAVTDYELIASHEKGVTRVALTRLPDAFRRRFRADVTPETFLEPLPLPSSYVTAVPEVAPAYVPAEDARNLPPLPSSKPLPRVVPPSHSREQVRFESLQKSVRILKERVAALEAMELKDQQTGLEKADFDRPGRFSDNVEQRTRELAAEEKRLNDLARNAEATSHRRQSEIADLRERIAKHEAEIAALEATRYRQ
jgi:DNA repair exonuclease SbcCD ATPase subunit